jgi:membrane-associated phospholipid phosphatase
MQLKASRFTWPDRNRVAVFIGYGSLLCVLWVIIYGGASWFTGLHDYRIRLGWNEDSYIPFLPEMAVIYLSLFPMIWLSLFILPTTADIKQFARTLVWLFVISGIGFLILPGQTFASAKSVEGHVQPVFEFADWINLEHNYLPSLHVGMAVVCAYAYGRQLSRRVAGFIWVWAAAVAFSTLLTHQHYLADVVAGGVVGWIVSTFCFRTRASHSL